MISNDFLGGKLLQKFTDWLAKPIGIRLLDLERRKLNTIFPRLFGYDAVLLGPEEFRSCLDDCLVKRHTVVNQTANTSPGIDSRLDKLAIANETADLIYLAHCLEFAENPHEILREVYRALRPDGNIIISMFNPWSLWSIYTYSWKANFISIAKLQDWLALLGFDIMRVNRFGFMLPVSKKQVSSKLSWWERTGQRLEAPMAGAFVIEASKRTVPLTPIRPKWQEQTEAEIVVEDGTEPTT